VRPSTTDQRSQQANAKKIGAKALVWGSHLSAIAKKRREGERWSKRK